MNRHPAWPIDVPVPRRQKPQHDLWVRLLVTIAVASVVFTALRATA